MRRKVDLRRRRSLIQGTRAVTAALTFATVLVAAAVVAPQAQAQTYKVLHTFTAHSDGSTPDAGLIRDRAGNVYGTTYHGGPSDLGTVFKVDNTGVESVLYSFSGCCDVYKQGSNPLGGLVRDAAGNFYGTTLLGGAFKQGTVFKLDTAGTETVLYSFSGTGDGAQPYAGLVRDAAGNLYGTTTFGGDVACDCGTVFKLDAAGKETSLYSFTRTGGDGANPYDGGLVRDAAGNLYGTTTEGGDLSCGAGYGCGIVFSLNTAGHEMVLHIFTGTGGDGANPNGTLLRDRAGNLYGTANAGGNESSCVYGGAGCGIVFKVDAAGAETILYTFSGPDGAAPTAGLIRDAAGNFYGTTDLGGDMSCSILGFAGCGTVFELDTTGKETVLYSFTGRDGANPAAGLVRDAAGNLYGTAQNGGELPSCDGGEPGCGVVFKLTP